MCYNTGMKNKYALWCAIGGVMALAVIYWSLSRGNAEEARRENLRQREAREQSAPAARDVGEAKGGRPERIEAEPPWAEGIIEDGEAPYSSGVFRFQNRWQQDVEGAHVVVYAGERGGDSKQGVIVVATIAKDLAKMKTDVYDTPGREGGVRIVRAESWRLVLRTQTGRTLIFDVEGRRFLGQEETVGE